MVFNIKLLRCLFSIAVLFFASHAYASTYNYESGQLTSVDGINALGGTWDVTFYDGSFTEVYGTTPLALSSDDARSLTQALISDINSLPTPLLPSDVFGCIDETSCLIMTTHNEPLLTFAGWTVAILPSQISLQENNHNITDVNFSNVTFAKWQVSSVPVPAAIWLFASGLLGLIGLARRKA